MGLTRAARITAELRWVWQEVKSRTQMGHTSATCEEQNSDGSDKSRNSKKRMRHTAWQMKNDLS